MATYMLTTADNPFNPLTHWDEWYTWDEGAGYHTCGLIARLTYNSSDISDADQDAEHDRAIDAILDINPTGNYIKIKIPKDSED